MTKGMFCEEGEEHVGPVERGPAYDWKNEAKHYSDECDKLRSLLDRVERSWETECDKLEAQLTAALKREAEYVDLLKEFCPMFQRMQDDGRETSANMFVFLAKAKDLLAKHRGEGT